MKRALPIAALLGVLAHPVAFSQSAREIAIKHDSAKAAELEQYLETNPEAVDRDDTELLLMGAYETTGANDKLLPILKNLYAQVPAADVRQKIGMAEEVAALTAASQGKEAASAFIEDAKKEFSGHPQSGQISMLLEGILKRPVVGDTLDIAFTATDGTVVDLSKMAGQVVLVDFWATWCAPCVQEMPFVTAAYDQYHAEGFQVVGISLDKEKAALTNFIKQKNMPWPQGFDREIGIAQRYGINAIPATFLIGKDGTVVATNLRGGALAAAVAKQLGE